MHLQAKKKRKKITSKNKIPSDFTTVTVYADDGKSSMSKIHKG